MLPAIPAPRTRRSPDLSSTRLGLRAKAEVRGGNGQGQPDAVDGDVEGEPVFSHAGCGDLQHHRSPMPSADSGCGCRVGGEMHVVPTRSPQSGPHDRVEVSETCAVEQNGGRTGRLKFEIDLDAVALVGANPRARLVETEPL